MKNLIQKLSRRERIAIIICAVVLFLGGIIYPIIKKAATYHKEQKELLENEVALLQSLNNVLQEAPSVKKENKQLRNALQKIDRLLFPPIKNPVMTKTMMIKLLKEFGPNLNITVSLERTLSRTSSNQMSLYVRGNGHYSDLIYFLRQIETHRPLIVIKKLTLTPIKERRHYSRRRRRSYRPSNTLPKITGISFNMSIQIYCQNKENGS